jgi:hypothetical protein
MLSALVFTSALVYWLFVTRAGSSDFSQEASKAQEPRKNPESSQQTHVARADEFANDSDTLRAAEAERASNPSESLEQMKFVQAIEANRRFVLDLEKKLIDPEALPPFQSMALHSKYCERDPLSLEERVAGLVARGRASDTVELRTSLVFVDSQSMALCSAIGADRIVRLYRNNSARPLSSNVFGAMIFGVENDDALRRAQNAPPMSAPPKPNVQEAMKLVLSHPSADAVRSGLNALVWEPGFLSEFAFFQAGNAVASTASRAELVRPVGQLYLCKVSPEDCLAASLYTILFCRQRFTCGPGKDFHWQIAHTHSPQQMQAIEAMTEALYQERLRLGTEKPRN